MRKLLDKIKSTKKIVSSAVVAAMAAVLLTGCGTGTASAGADNASASVQADGSSKLQVVTTIFPEYDWVREIVGQGPNGAGKSAADSVDITMLLDNGVDLHSFQPTAADIAKISTCDVFIYVGGESDGWVDDALKEAKNKDMVVIDLLDVLGEQVKEEEVVEGMQEEDEHEHEDGDDNHNEDDEHEDGHHHEDGEIEYDEHVWLSLKDAQILCNKIAEVLEQKDSANADIYKANAESYCNKLSELDKEYQTAVDTATVKTILFGDRFPFRYMADDYGIDYYAAFVGCSAETEASFETIIFLSGKIDELGLPAICTIEKSDQKIANTVKDNTKTKNQEILSMNSLQSITSSDVESGTTYLSAMKDNLEVLKKALGN
jgi:zinc transport system substrate-binding protein